MRNPYVTAAANHDAATRHLRPAQQTAHQAASQIPERVRAFFDALDIGPPAAKWSVATAVAHTMTDADLAEAERRLLADRAERVALLQSLNAPEVIVRNEERKHQQPLQLLARVRTRRQQGR